VSVQRIAHLHAPGFTEIRGGHGIFLVIPRGTRSAPARAVKLSRPLSFGALVALLFAASRSSASSSGDYERRDDLTLAVIACEEAYTRLENCCPGYSAWVGYDERRSPCLDLEWRTTSEGYSGPDHVDTGNTKPLELSESNCIRAMSCEDLVARGVCDRATTDPTIHDNTNGRSATRGICP
jgi:hypothetical protein